MKTCVLCLRRRNDFEWTMRSRSRWNGVRSGESGSGRTRLAGYERVASGDSHACSHAWVRSWKCSAWGATVAMDPDCLSGSGRNFAPACGLAVLERRLSRCHARDRDAVRRAAHVVEPGHVEEVDRVRVAAVLAAEAELKRGLGLAAGPRRQSHEPPDARLVDRLERAAVDDLLLHVGGE